MEWWDDFRSSFLMKMIRLCNSGYAKLPSGMEINKKVVTVHNMTGNATSFSRSNGRHS